MTLSGDVEGAGVVPSGAIDDHGGVDAVGQRGGEMGEEKCHHAGIDEGQHQGEVLAAGGAHGGEDVGPFVAELSRPPGSPAPMPPAMTDPALVADAGLVLEPELEPLAGARRPDAAQLFLEPPFLKRSSASASFSG